MNRLMDARFTKFGCEIKTFTTATAVLDAIRNRKPKLLLLDLNLGEGLSGFDVIETIRFDLKNDFPIIVISSESDSTKVAHAMELGATDFVVKPPFRFQFEEKVAEYIKTANLPEPTAMALRPVKAEHQNAKVDFQIGIQSVNPLGFTLRSTHLIKKGSSFWLSGPKIKEMIPSTERIFVMVLESAIQLTQDQRVYEIRVEVDPTQEKILEDIKGFLSRSRNPSGS